MDHVKSLSLRAQGESLVERHEGKGLEMVLGGHDGGP